MYQLTHQGQSLRDLTAIADIDEGPFGDHLRRILVLIANDEQMMSVIMQMLEAKPIPDAGSFYRLRSGGLVTGESRQSARFRCGIYKTYLQRHLA
jgi:hypothetical protein